MGELAFRRVLLKLSGESLMGGQDFGIDPAVVGSIWRWSWAAATSFAA
jgi:uridylate kinase